METRIRRSLLGTCVGIVMISCCISGVACDVPDGVVYTDLHRSVRIGDRVVLKCQSRGTPLAVYWKKLDDLRRVTTLVSWLIGDPVTGLCVDERLCPIMEMNKDHSLVIKEVSIAEQGRYICRVANYKGILIQNFTEISVFSPPKKPYPFINECQRSSGMKSNQTCVISTAEDTINISCTVSGYFPDLDLFFLRGSRYITHIHSEEMTNGDGKKNKSITSQVSPSPEPYVCVASDIPGVAGRSVASLLVTTVTASVNRADSTLAAKIVVLLIVIIVLIAVILIAIILWRIRQQEPVSYVELWKLVDESDLAKVNDIVSKLVGNLEKNLGKEDLYRRLCEWKEGSSVNVRSLYRAIKKLGFIDDLKTIKGNQDEDDEMTAMDHGSRELHRRVKTSSPNQMIRLCLAVEEAGKRVDESHRSVYLQLAKTFFKIRDEYKSELTDWVLEGFALNVPERQCQRLGNTMELPENVTADKNEDGHSVTNARKLYQNLDNYEIRRRRRQTAKRYDRHDIPDVFIPKDQSNVMPLMGPDPLTLKDENQCPQNGVSDDSYSRVSSPKHSACRMSTQPTSGLIQIQVLNYDSKTHMVRVRPTDTVKDLKVQIQEKLQRLQFQGRILDDMSTRSLKSHGLQDLSTVHLHCRLMGGALF